MLSRQAALVCVVLVGAVGACGTDSAPASGPPPAPGPDAGSVGPSDAGPTPTDPTYPLAQGDPCRGLPLPVDASGGPVDHYVPAGMCARLVAADIAGLRQLAFAPNGDLFGTTSSTIYLLRDADGDGYFTAQEIHDWAKTGGTGNNSHVDAAGGFLYAGSSNRVRRFAYDPASLKGGPAEDVVVGAPEAGNHPLHTTHVFDNWLYVHSGSVGNASNETSKTAYDTKRSLVKRFDLSKFVPGAPFQWDAGEAFTLGLRNMVGFARNETTKKMYGVVNGLDFQEYKGIIDLFQDNPGEQVVELAAGKTYGYPFCFTAQRIVDNGTLIPPGTQLINVGFAGGHDDAWCAANSSKPTTFVQAHSAPLDLAFFDKQPQGGLPAKYRGGAFIAFHGSWNRLTPTGHQVVWQPFNADGTAPMPESTMASTRFKYEVVFGDGDKNGPKDGAWSWQSTDGTKGEGPRPAGVAVGPIDGALYIASDEKGYLYRLGVKN